MKLCPKCKTEHENNGIYCSRSCANSRGPRSNQFKENIRLKLTGIKRSQDSLNKIVSKKEETGSCRKKTNCIICNNPTGSRSKKTCSEECLKILQAKNSLNQKKHGGGHKGLYKGIHCDSTYELAFLIWHLDNKNNICRCSEKRSYNYNGQKYLYLPDFIVDGKIYEVKGFLSNKAKTKIDQNNDIILLLKEDITPFIDYVKSKYCVNDLRMLYDDKITFTHICLCCKKVYENMKEESTFCSRKCSGTHQRSVNLTNNRTGFYKD